jgi:hypothetical protein
MFQEMEILVDMINRGFKSIDTEKKTVPKRILLTGARSPTALELARHLHQSGHTVFAADTSTLHVLKFSNAIKRFYDFPSPRYDLKRFIGKLGKIITEEKIDLVIPMWEEVIYISLHRDSLPSNCEIFCSQFQLLHDLHHKWHFIKLLGSLGIKTPNSVLLRSNNDLKKFEFKKPYVLKKCYSRGSRFVYKVTSPQPPEVDIQPENPWIAQDYLQGKKFCSYSICQKGKVLAHTVYPVNYTIDGSSCVAFEAVEHPDIFEWVKNIVQKVGFTGQIAFDFIENNDGILYAIECNPRATSGIHLFKPEDRIDKAFLNLACNTITPKPGNSQQIAVGMLMYGLGIGVSEKKLPRYLRKFFTTKDVVFSLRDLKPFLLEPIVLGSYWLKSKKLRVSIPILFTQDLEWDENPDDLA